MNNEINKTANLVDAGMSLLGLLALYKISYQTYALIFKTGVFSIFSSVLWVGVLAM